MKLAENAKMKLEETRRPKAEDAKKLAGDWEHCPTKSSRGRKDIRRGWTKTKLEESHRPLLLKALLGSWVRCLPAIMDHSVNQHGIMSSLRAIIVSCL